MGYSCFFNDFAGCPSGLEPPVRLKNTKDKPDAKAFHKHIPLYSAICVIKPPCRGLPFHS